MHYRYLIFLRAIDIIFSKGKEIKLMKNRGLAAYVLITAMTVFLLGCGNSKTGAASGTEAAAEEISSSALTGDQQQVVDESVNVAEEEAVKTLQMKIADTVVEVAWEENESVEALRKLCEAQPLTIEMSMYGGFEQVGSIGSNLPRNDVETTTSAGDIVLYSGNKMVVFYGSNSWAYTRLGHITDQDEAGMAQLLSNGDVTITVSLETE